MTATSATERRLHAAQGDVDGAVVEPGRPLRRARVLEAGAQLQHDRDRIVGPEAQARGVIVVGAGQDLEHGGAERLVDPAVVAQPELRARRRSGAAAGPRPARRSCARPRSRGAGAGCAGRRPGRPPARPARTGRRRAARASAGRCRRERPRGRPIRARPRASPMESCASASACRATTERASRASTRAQETRRARGIAGEQTLARLRDLRIGGRRRALVDRLHEAARKAEHAAVLLVAELRAFVPGAVGLDHAAVGERDRVRARPRRTRATIGDRDRGAEGPAAAVQGRASDDGEHLRRRPSAAEVLGHGAARAAVARRGRRVEPPAEAVAVASLEVHGQDEQLGAAGVVDRLLDGLRGAGHEELDDRRALARRARGGRERARRVRDSCRLRRSARAPSAAPAVRRPRGGRAPPGAVAGGRRWRGRCGGRPRERSWAPRRRLWRGRPPRAARRRRRCRREAARVVGAGRARPRPGRGRPAAGIRFT